MTKFLKIFAITLLSLIFISACLFLTYFILTKDAVLDENKLIGAGRNVVIYDNDDNEVVSASLDVKNKSVSVKNLKEDTINAFIASEDRTFYSHNGLNYKRILKALYKNVISGSFKEGASTISQQLIKNTHLSNDKTIKRKLNEIKLTRKLEKKYDKDAILEMYLNTIYFGHSCYGLQSAANFYFNKKAEELDLTESATIVGLLSSPNNYSPFKNPEKSLKRRNIVLKAMLDCGFIDNERFTAAVAQPLNVVSSTAENKYGDYVGAIFDELADIDLNYYTLTDGCIIKTYLNQTAQNYVEGLDYPCDNSVIITDNDTCGVIAYKSTINGAKRQPGSTVKPIFVYAPAIEEKQLSPFTKILDEKVDFNGYSPENFDKKYHGYVTVTDALKYSYNVPAVKTLNALTLKKAEKYLNAMDVDLEEDEKNLSLALGGMKYGLSLKELADRYTIFANDGNYSPSRFIKEILTKDGKTIYQNERVSNHVFSLGTCSLINEMLEETAESGTAKKLKTLNFDVAVKTGTCGNAEGNTDAYAVSYTSKNCIAVWLGDKDNNRTDITGGNDCCALLKQILEKIYEESRPESLDTISGTVKIDIDREEYNENNKIILSDPIAPKLNVLSVKVLKGNVPTMQSERFSNPSIPAPEISVSDGTVNIELCHAKYYSFLVNRAQNGQNEVIYDGQWQEIIKDTPDDGYYIYSVTPYYVYEDNKVYGKEICLPSVHIVKNEENPEVKIPDIAFKDWYNQ